MKKGKRLIALLTAVILLIPALICNAEGFADVSETNKAWYYDAVTYVSERGLMNGTGANNFSPSAKVSRAQMVQILFNMEGKNSADYQGKTGFSDSDNAWYSPAIKWAKESGVTKGTTDTTFSPNKNITRQEMTQFIYSYSNFKGYDTAKSTNLDNFADNQKVASWAMTSVKWAVAEKIVSGALVNGNLYLNPENTAMRNELATIIMNYHKKFSGEPLLRFVAMSDVHIGDTNTEESLRRTLTYINTFGEMDAFMVSGDLTNTTATTADASQIVKFNAIFEEEIEYDTSMVYSLGPSHDLPYAESGLECRKLFADNLSKDFFTTDVTPAEMAALGVRHSIIGGYHFFSIDHEGAGFYDEAMVWLVAEIEKAVAENPEKPFFVSTHVPEMPHIKALLQSYPQAICFTGHLHNSASREDSIRQDDGYTNIHCGGMNYYRVDGYNRFNDNPFLNLGNIYEFAQAIMVEVYADNSTKIQRLDGYNSSPIGEPWIVSADTFGKYTDERKDEGLCYFEDDADLEILVLNDRYLKISFDPCVAGAAGPAKYYMIELIMPIYGQYATVDHVELSSGEVFFPNGEGIPDLYYTYTFDLETLEDFAVKVTAFDCWGQSQNALIYNGSGYEEVGVGNVSVTIRDFTPEEEFTGFVTEGEDDIEFAYTGSSQTSNFTDDYSMAVRFYPTVAFSDVEIRCSSWGDTVGTLDFALYKWQGDYASTLSSEAVELYSLSGFKGSTVYNIFNGDYESAEYLIVITTPNAEEGVGLYHYPAATPSGAYISYENGEKTDTQIYFSWTNSKTCTKPYVSIK